MSRKKLVATVAALALSLVSVTFTPIAAQATVNAGCETPITNSGIAASISDVEITSYGVYCVARFLTVSDNYSFTVPSGISTLDYLVVAGGGGGGSGGGGAGGLLQASNYPVTSGEQISVSVGRGGTGGAGGRATQIPGTKGVDSSFGPIIAKGGGAGGTEGIADYSNVNGGSGGGSQFDCVSAGCGAAIAGTSVANQGNNGGYSTYNSYGAGGGGGGAGGAGFNTTRNYIGGNGGIGIASDITGVSTYYAGGGGGGINSNDNAYIGLDSSGNLLSTATVQTNGGGQGGLGGGGTGSSYGFRSGTQGQFANATSGAPNTGGGGGGTDPEDINAGNGGSGIVILRWISNTNLKTITFNSNTQSPTISSQKVGSGISTALKANSFTRTGWVFNGWASNPDGSGDRYAEGANITTTSDVTLYAQWLAGVTHTVSFNSNNGSGSMANQVSGASVPLNPNTFTRTNYTFAGWNTNADGSGFAYENQASYTFSSDATMYAQWQLVVPTFKVTFYGNAADGGSTASQSASNATPLNLNGFSRTGYNFLGWNSSYSAGTAEFLDGQTYSFTADINLYAQWVPQSSNTITYEKNDSIGSPATGTMSNQAASSNTQITANAYVRPGYTFRNWNTAADGSGTSYLANYTYSFASSRTLYAQWGLNINISFNPNNPTSGSAPARMQTYVGSPGINLPTNSGNLVKNGYRLAGWNTRDDGLGTPYALGANSIKFSSPITLYAHWTPATYTVIYSGNGNSAGSEPPLQTFTFGSTVNVRDNVGSLVRDGYKFVGWNTAADGTGSTFAPAQTAVALSSDTVLFAQWTSAASVPSGNDSSKPESPTTQPIKSPAITKKLITVTGFKPGSATLTQVMKKNISKYQKAAKSASNINCTGYTMGPKILKVDESLARRRAIAVCEYLKAKTNPAFSFSSKSVTTHINSGEYRKTVVTLSY